MRQTPARRGWALTAEPNLREGRGRPARNWSHFRTKYRAAVTRCGESPGGIYETPEIPRIDRRRGCCVAARGTSAAARPRERAVGGLPQQCSSAASRGDLKKSMTNIASEMFRCSDPTDQEAHGEHI